jgi:leucyl aminopeptidase
MHPVFNASSDSAIPITFVSKSACEATIGALPPTAAQFVRASGFKGKSGDCLLAPADDGSLAQVLFGIEEPDGAWHDPFRAGQLPKLLPPGTYRFANTPHDARLAALAFALGSYSFSRYRKAEPTNVKLALPDGVDGAEISRIADAVTLARDLINTPSNDMGPEELAAAAKAVAARYGASGSAASSATIC